MDTQERIKARHRILDILCASPEYRASVEEIKRISPKALDDLVWLGFVRVKGGEAVLKKDMAERWKRIKEVSHAISLFDRCASALDCGGGDGRTAQGEAAPFEGDGTQGLEGIEGSQA